MQMCILIGLKYFIAYDVIVNVDSLDWLNQ